MWTGMGSPDCKSNKRVPDIVDIVKSWIPRRAEPGNLSRDFWMPDHSCRVCYECDAQFTVFNRKHHCRLCGRVFCSKCTANSIPAPSSEPRTCHEEWERIRVCNFCFKQWDRGVEPVVDNGAEAASPQQLSPSPSTTSLASTRSSCTCNSSNNTASSTRYSTGSYQRVSCTSDLNPQQPGQMDPQLTVIEQDNVTSGNIHSPTVATFCPSPNHFRSDDEDDDYGAYRSDSEMRHFAHSDVCCEPVNIGDFERMYRPHEVHHGENSDSKSISCSPPRENSNAVGVGIDRNGRGEEYECDGYECDASDSAEDAKSELVDFENNGLLWLPPEPEDVADEKEAVFLNDYDEDDGEGAAGEWGYLRPSNSFGIGEYRSRDRAGEEHRKAMKNVVEGHFRALVSQLLQVENLQAGEENDKHGWLDTITSLSWEAATLLKPDTSKSGGMDPGGYVKVKCIASGLRHESMVLKGVVCKKNVAHRRMVSKIDKPRLLILGGALEYQRVSNLLSSVDTLLQQEMDHLKMAVAKLDAHQPNILLVEKSVSRYAQEYLLAKDISLVLNIKRPLLERIARCTGAQIVPSIDHLISPKLGYCDAFHVDKFFENHGSAGQDRKKLTKTLMFFEGCPKPLGCTILLKGANGDELKKVKHVVQYAVFAAYHLALETSFLADEGASLPELPLKSPITVALPNKLSSFDRSISTIPGFAAPGTTQPSTTERSTELQKITKEKSELQDNENIVNPTCFSNVEHTLRSSDIAGFAASFSLLGQERSDAYSNQLYPNHVAEKESILDLEHSSKCANNNTEKVGFSDQSFSTFSGTAVALDQHVDSGHAEDNVLVADSHMASELPMKKDGTGRTEEIGCRKEEFPPSPSDHQSILVSLSTRCVWKGTVCVQAHLLRIKYYGSFDKPLGRYLRDHLFDPNHRCRSCEMPSEAHVHCYTHRQGSLTISVKKLPESLLPGERDGKIWMWHRCLRCPRTNGFPPTTRRVLMSDAAWGLSFGKFLELSFSNHAAASRVASCGHSLHRDCLRFYGFGRMVACFRYASIDVHSVYLPPSKVEFNYDNMDWVQKELNEVRLKADLLFAEGLRALHQIKEKAFGLLLKDGDAEATESPKVSILEFEAILQKEKQEFQESLKKTPSGEVVVGQPAIDILEINKLRREILFHSYVWDQRLIDVANVNNMNVQEGQRSSISRLRENRASVEKLFEMDLPSKPSKGFSSCDSFLKEMDLNQREDDNPSSEFSRVRNKRHGDMDLNMNVIEAECYPSTETNITEKMDGLESGIVVRRVHSESQLATGGNLSDTLDAAWTGKNYLTATTPKENSSSVIDSSQINAAQTNSESNVGRGRIDAVHSHSSTFAKSRSDILKCTNGMGIPFPGFYDSFKRNSSFNAQKLGISNYSPTYISLFKELERQSGARLLLPVGINDTIIPVYDDEPTSAIAYALVSSDYHVQISELENPKFSGDSAGLLQLFDSGNIISHNSIDDSASNTLRSFGSTSDTFRSFSSASDTLKSLNSMDEGILSISGSRGSLVLDPLVYTKDLHARVSFTDEGPLGRVKYTVTCYYAKRFEALRRTCCPSELDFVRSLSRCKKWGAQGGKSNVFFAKTLDDRFIIKQVTKTELESFVKFGPAYFKYLSESIGTGSPTCLAKILGIYQVSSKHVKGGKESKMDLLVMENLLFRRSVTRLYDLKGSSRSRYNPDTSGSNKVLLDQNLIEAMPTSPIFVGNKAKRLLERAVWNDTSFLASIDVMDYSLLVGVDEEKHELVLGIIDFMRQYTWDKHLETWVKTSGILGGSKNTTPTVISPQQYKKRFRKAMTAYFLMVPDQWSPPTIIRSESQSDVCEEK